MNYATTTARQQTSGRCRPAPLDGAGLAFQNRTPQPMKNYLKSFFKLRRIISAGSGSANIATQNLSGASPTVASLGPASVRPQPFAAGAAIVSRASSCDSVLLHIADTPPLGRAPRRREPERADEAGAKALAAKQRVAMLRAVMM